MKRLLFLSAVLLLAACSPEPRPIEYGFDSCDHCRMTIVDDQHAAEAVTNKGKVFKFDAIECVVPFVEKEEEQNFAFILVADYASPGKLTDAKTGTFLISSAIPSPMGAFLSAFEEREKAVLLQQEKGGELFTWEELKRHLGKEGMATR